MVIFPELSALQISFVHLLGVTGAGLILQRVVDRENNTHRAILFAVAWLFGLRYAFWRATATLAPMGFTVSYVASISLFALEMIAMVSSLSAFVMMSRFKLRSKEADQFAGWWQRNNGKDPKVAVMIATYNEELEVLERTIIGAKSLRHVNKQVIILDDGKRDWLRDYCQSQGVRYMRRPDNKGAKAGNINHALGVLAQDSVPPDYVAVLDADFVPHRGFISRTLALFHDPDVGLV
ncbi:glycosyltransferase, partial [Thioclava sp. BHET1]